jgi:hypothetical protein
MELSRNALLAFGAVLIRLAENFDDGIAVN